MERPHYRRVTGIKAPAGSMAPAGIKHNNRSDRSSFSERLTAQFIVCGVIMALLLIMNLINVSLTQDLSVRVKGVIQGQPTTEDVKQVINNVSDTARAIFGNRADDYLLDNFDLASDVLLNNEESFDNTALVTSKPDDFRIDEDILELIQAESGGR